MKLVKQFMLAVAALLVGIIIGTVASAQSFREYGKCVTIPAGQESKYLLGGRADFMDGIRWTFNYDRTDRGVLTVETRTKDEYGGSWFTSIWYKNVFIGTADSFGDRNINYNGGKVTGHLGTNNSLQLTVNVPHRLKFSAPATQSVKDHSGCS